MKKITLLLCLSISSCTPLAAQVEESREIYSWLRTVSEVCTALKNRTFRAIDFRTAFIEGLKSMVSTADAHSSFFSPDSYKSTLESASGEFIGIGVSITPKLQRDDALVIVDTIQGGPAEKAGLLGRDKIVEVDGTKLKGVTTDEVIKLLKGKRGTIVKLKVIRESKPLELKINREIIKDKTSSGYHISKYNIYYIAFRQFAENSVNHLNKIINKATKNKARGLIIDLRRNPGGVLESSVDIAGLFTEKDSTIVITKDKEGNIVKKYNTTSHPIFKKNMPIFLLIDSFTASAAEILSGALMHYSDQQDDPQKKNLIVFTLGTQSFGKGSVQEVFPVSNKCALKLTTMLYFLPNDTSIQAKGIAPDFLIKPKTIPEKELKWINELYGKETTLKGHITREEVENPGIKIDRNKKKKATVEKEEEEKTWKQRHQEALSKDVQLQTSINMINMLNFVKATQPEHVATRRRALEFLNKHFVTDEMLAIQEVK